MMKATIDIDKVKLKSEMFLEVEYQKNFEDKHRNQVSEACNAPVHPDLVAAFEKLVPHLAILTEYVPESAAPEDIDSFEHPDLEKFKVTQISIGSDGDGVTITGRRVLKNKKVLNLNAPYTKYYEENGYRFGADLQIAVSHIIEETQLYLDGVKFGEGKQLEMELGDGETVDGEESAL
jgi:hypothetical protein